ncbi:heparan-alpha-glucosaminide N-acetyltransferase domain-containing protein [Nesterenkonia populi]|uniref:heparan-alpha-glucosaminide N-acetyltransferase domain-containing protein n=1 Tax=Nesterenkonia populi TaxID=1591087 RepID=UPI001FE41B2E|nr:heparan-alpha-glucosaminide N-acetyltransferase domain-containing protein [Nesterenkonia populi]
MSRTGTNPRKASGRLWGVDAARGVALIGMMSVHVISTQNPDGSASTAGLVFSGRSAALFAVLAGVGLALLSSSTTDRLRLSWTRRSVVVRAVLIILIGCVLALMSHGVAVILVNYGLMFLLALPFLRLGAKALAGIAAGFALLGPAALYFWQNALRETPVSHPERLWHSPTFLDLSDSPETFADPGTLVLDLVVTGYYPLLVWPAYFFAGMAIGRLNLRRLSTALALAGAGLAGAAATWLVGWATVQNSGIFAHLQQASGYDPVEVQGALDTNDHLLPFITHPAWFGLVTPHQGSPTDLVHTLSTSMLVLGVCLLLAKALPWLMAPLAGAGAMPLTLYVGHLLVLHVWSPDEGLQQTITPPILWAGFIITFLVLGLAKILLDRRGPLEAATAGVAAAVAGPKP